MPDGPPPGRRVPGVKAMTKFLTRPALAALAALSCALTSAAQSGAAQTPAPESDVWVTVSPAGEEFTAQMPGQPTASEESVEAGELKASGTRYAVALDDRTTFIIWAMKGDYGAVRLGTGDQAGVRLPAWMHHLDAAAELAWELVVRPEAERMEREKLIGKSRAEHEAQMMYQRELELSGHPAREYSVKLKGVRGSVHVCADGERVYLVAALGAGASDPRLKQFIDSFALKTTAAPPPKEAGGAGAGMGGKTGVATPAAGTSIAAANDYTKPFRYSEVKKKATITEKPEPGFTEEARRFNVSGVVRLLAVLAASGEVQNIQIVKGLPHGLTEKSVAAAQKVRFNPAQKDGRAVSQFVIFEYNYNIY